MTEVQAQGAVPRVPDGVRIRVVGNLTGDPVVAETSTGNPWAHFTVASNERFRRPDGVWESLPPKFTEVSVFSRRGLDALAGLGRGDRVEVVGEPDIATFTRRDGTPGAALRVKALAVEPAPLPKREPAGPSAGAGQAPLPPEPVPAQPAFGI